MSVQTSTRPTSQAEVHATTTPPYDGVSRYGKSNVFELNHVIWIHNILNRIIALEKITVKSCIVKKL